MSRTQSATTFRALDDQELDKIFKSDDLAKFLQDVLPALQAIATEQFPPLISDEAIERHKPFLAQLLRKPAGKQAELIGAAVEMVHQGMPTLICVEPGGGKTKIAINAIMGAYNYDFATGKFQGKRTDTGFDKQEPHVFIVAPGYLVAKWQREIVEKECPGARVMIARTLSDLLPRKTGLSAENAHFVILSYDRISRSANRELAAVRRPIVVQEGPLNKERGERMYVPLRDDGQIVYGLHCPDCGALLVDEDGNYHTPASLTRAWQHCGNVLTTRTKDAEGKTIFHQRVCKAPLWQNVANPPEYVMDGHRYTGKQHHMLKDGKPFGMPREYDIKIGVSTYRVRRRGPRAFALAEYVANQMHGSVIKGKQFFVTDVILDEIHMTKAQGTARGIAAARLAWAAHNSVIGLTGTLMGGYASTLFYLFYRLSMRFRESFGFDEVSVWVGRYGFQEMTYVEGESEDVGRASKRRNAKKNIKEIPGLLPEAMTYCMAFTLFGLLKEMFTLPEYTERVHYVDLDETKSFPIKFPVLGEDGLPQSDEEGNPLFNTFDHTQSSYYRATAGAVREWAKRCLVEGSQRGLAAMLQTELRVPNAPHDKIHVVDRKTGRDVVNYPPLHEGQHWFPKERQLVAELVASARNNRKSLVYYVSVDKGRVGYRLEEAIRSLSIEMGRPLKTAMLTSETVSPEDREGWIREQLDKGIDVLLANPYLVQMGLDLTEFPDLHFYQIPYSIYVMIQASRRSLRPMSTQDVVVHYWCYRFTFEPNVIHLMASKARAANQFVGNLIESAFVEQAGEGDATLNVAKLLFSQMEPTDEAKAQQMLDLAKAERAKARPKIIEMELPGIETALVVEKPIIFEDIFGDFKPADYAQTSLFGEPEYVNITGPVDWSKVRRTRRR